jgi:hypothetical protein
MQITAELEHYHDVRVCVCMYIYMVKWSFTSSPYMYVGFMTWEEFYVLYCHFYTASTQSNECRKRNTNLRCSFTINRF